MRLLALLIASSWLIACGQKGALVLPDKKPKSTVGSSTATPAAPTAPADAGHSTP